MPRKFISEGERGGEKVSDEGQPACCMHLSRAPEPLPGSGMYPELREPFVIVRLSVQTIHYF